MASRSDAYPIEVYMDRLFMTYSEVKLALMAAGMRDRQARTSLMVGREVITPHPHGLHSQRLWLRTVVVAHCLRISTQTQSQAA